MSHEPTKPTIVFFNPIYTQLTSAGPDTDSVTLIKAHGKPKRRTWSMVSSFILKEDEISFAATAEAVDLSLAEISQILEDIRPCDTVYADQRIERSVKMALTRAGLSYNSDGDVEIEHPTTRVCIPILRKPPSL